MFKIIKITLLFPIFFFAAGCGQKTQQAPAKVPSGYNYTHKLQVGGKTLMVEIADTPEKREKGLSQRSAMEEDQGMLFIFDSGNVRPGFWMKDMKFNLDLIWINDKKIIGITADVPKPDVNCQSSIVNCLPTYPPPSAIDEVLEVNAGWVKREGIRIGNDVKLLE